MVVDVVSVAPVLDEVAEVNSSWLATLDLQLEKKSRGTRLTKSRHQGPLYVQKPFYPEGPDLAHVYLLHPPGGLVSGDHLKVSIEAKENAAVLVTTPGAARIYRARETQSLQRQSVRLDAGTNASVEWFPLETIVYNNANVELDTEINLAKGSRFICWEVTCFGLPASDEPFVAGAFQQHYRILREGRPLFVDRFSLTETNRERLLSGSAAMNNHAVNGFFLAGPFVNFEGSTSDEGVDPAERLSALMMSLRSAAAELGLAQSGAISKTGDFFIGRYLGSSAEQSRKLFTAWWEILRPLVLKRKACAPRIWST